MWLVYYALAILARALILLAFSEFIFLNEQPVLALVRAGQNADVLLHLVQMIAFYLLPASLLFALEPRMTRWSSCILVGALVGWSIEGAVVPAVYEAPPFSFFWTSVAWHAPVDVWFGIVILTGMVSRAVTAKGAAAIALCGLTWGIWASWTWPEVVLSSSEFISLAVISAALIGLGFILIKLTPGTLVCSVRWRFGFIALNVALGLVWASLAPVFGVLLGALILGNAAVLRLLPPKDPIPPNPSPMAVPAFVYLGTMATSAIAGYWIILTWGTPIGGEELAPMVALAGTLIWLAALADIFIKQRRAK